MSPFTNSPSGSLAWAVTMIISIFFLRFVDTFTSLHAPSGLPDGPAASFDAPRSFPGRPAASFDAPRSFPDHPATLSGPQRSFPDDPSRFTGPPSRFPARPSRSRDFRERRRRRVRVFMVLASLCNLKRYSFCNRPNRITVGSLIEIRSWPAIFKEFQVISGYHFSGGR